MSGRRILTLGLNPALQKTLVFPSLVSGEVNRTHEYHLDAAGKGLNVSRVLTQLGKDSLHLTHLGGSLRPLFLDLCAADGLKLEWVENTASIRFCYTLIHTGNHSVTELVEEGERAGEETEARLLEAYTRLLPSCSLVVVSGSRTAGISSALVPEMVRLAKALGLVVILDLRGEDLRNSLPYRPDLIKPNFDEFTATFAPELAFFQADFGEEAVKKKTGEICRNLWAQYGCCTVITRGGRAIWYGEGGELTEFPVESVETLNTTGSGDAFTAGLAAALEEGMGLASAVAEGARCGKLNAGLLKPGVIH